MSSVLFQGFYSSSVSTFHLFFIVLLGAISKKLKIVSNSFHLSLAKVVTNIVLPCFIFSQILNNFRIYQYKIIIESFICCSFLFLSGILIALMISKLLKLTKCQSHFLAAIFSTPHTTSIPVILIQIIGPLLDTVIPAKAGITATATKRGFLYIVINSIFSNIWRWSGSYYLINPEKSENNKILDEEALMMKDREDENKPLQVSGFSSWVKMFVKKIVNAPLVTAICSLLFTVSPHVQNYFITPGYILNETFISVLLMTSKSYSFLTMFMLGLSIADQIHFGNKEESVTMVEGKEKNFLTFWDLFWLAIVKLVVMPLAACPLLILIVRSWLGCDDVMLFLYLFMAAAPSAINVIVICNYKNAFVQACSTLMIFMYTVALFTLTLQITFFVYLIGELNAPDGVTV